MLSRRLCFALLFSITTLAQTAHAGEPEEEAAASSGASSAVVWGGLSVAAVGLAVGTGAGIMSMTTSARVDAKCGNLPCPMNVGDDIDDAAMFAKIALVGVTVGALGLGAAIFGLLTREPTSLAKGAHASTRLNVGPTSIGLAGSF